MAELAAVCTFWGELGGFGVVDAVNAADPAAPASLSTPSCLSIPRSYDSVAARSRLGAGHKKRLTCSAHSARVACVSNPTTTHTMEDAMARPLTIMLALAALVAVPVAVACYVVAGQLPTLNAALAAIGD